jgi:hypothetical protein
MKTITLWQPWASLIVEGVKTIETRGREHPWRSAIGQTIAIHAAKTDAHVEQQHLGEWHSGRFGPCITPELHLRNTSRIHILRLGAVLGTCKLIDVVPTAEIGWSDCPTLSNHYGLGGAMDDACTHGFSQNHNCLTVCTRERPFGDFAPGRFALLLDEVVKFDEPIPAKGKQGLWTWGQ